MSRSKKATEIHNKSRYQNMTVNGRALEAVFRIQTASTKKVCCLEGCVLGGEIKVYQDYARVYYPDTEELEIMHEGCFRREFEPDA